MLSSMENRGRLPSTAIPLDTKNKIISLYLNDYSNANFTHFCEIIQRELGVKISDTTLNYWLRRENVISPKARRRTKKNMKRLLKARLDNSNSNKVKNSIKESIALIDEKNAHPRRPRSKYAGEMIQMDASSFLNGLIMKFGIFMLLLMMPMVKSLVPILIIRRHLMVITMSFIKS